MANQFRRSLYQSNRPSTQRGYFSTVKQVAMQNAFLQDFGSQILPKVFPGTPTSVAEPEIVPIPPTPITPYYFLGGIMTNYGNIASLDEDLNINDSFSGGFIYSTDFYSGEIRSVARQQDGKLIVGGYFDYYGTPTIGLVELDSSGSLASNLTIGGGFIARISDYYYDNVTGYPSAIVSQSNGKTLVIGNFNYYNGQQICNIVRYNTDNTVDDSFNSEFGFDLFEDYGIYNPYIAKVLTDDKILIGGGFSEYNGIPQSKIAKINQNGGIDENFKSGFHNYRVGFFYNPYVTSIEEQQDGKILIGGNFTFYSGSSASGIVCINSSGSIDETTFNFGEGFNGSSQVARNILTQSDGKMIIYGDFYYYSGSEARQLARLNTDGTLDTSFSSGYGIASGNYIFPMAIQSDGKIVIGGTFSYYSGSTVNRIIRINTDGSIDSSFNVGIGPTGSFYAANYLNSSIYDIKIQSDGKILVCGDFRGISGSTSWFITRLNSNGTVDSSFAASSLNNVVRSMAIQSDGKIVACGDFTNMGPHIVRFNTNGTFDLYNSTSIQIRKIAIQSDQKIVGLTSNGILRLNTDGTRDSSLNSGSGFSANNVYGLTGFTQNLTIQTDGKIIVTGDFNQYSGSSQYFITRINPNGTIDEDFKSSGFNASPYSVIVNQDGKLISTGNFTAFNAKNANRLVRINQDGSLDESFKIGRGFYGGYSLPNDDNQGGVNSIKIQSDNKIIVGGAFLRYSSSAEYNYSFIRLNPDGTKDTSFEYTGSGFAGGTITSMDIQSDGKIVVGGYFYYTTGSYSSPDYAAYSNLVRINTDGTADKSFNTGDGPDNDVFKVKIESDGKIFVGGTFSYYSGSSPKYIMKLNSDGTIDETFQGPLFLDDDGRYIAVNDILTKPNGNILACGELMFVGKSQCNNIVRLNEDFTVDTDFNIGTGFDSYVNKIKVQSDGKILVGGDFTDYSGSIATSVVRINEDGTLDSSYKIQFYDDVRDILIDSEHKTIFAGDFFGFYKIASYILSVNSDFSPNDSFNENVTSGFDEDVYALGMQSDGKIIAGGWFSTYNGISQNYIVRLNTDATLDTSFNIGSGFNDGINSLEIQSDGKILLGGYFTSYSGSTLNRLVRINTDGTIDESFYSGYDYNGFNDYVQVVKIQPDGKILVGGNFTYYSGSTQNLIARLNSDGTIDTSFDSGWGFDTTVYTIAIQSDGKILVGGNFSYYSGSSQPSKIIRLNQDGTEDTTFNYGDGFNYDVYSIAVQPDGKIVVGGDFTSYSGSTQNYITRLNSDGTVDTTFNTGDGFDWRVNAIEIQSNGKIIVGGAFNNYSGSTQNYITRLNSDGTIDTSIENLNITNAIRSILILPPNKILFGGDFYGYSDVTSFRIAKIGSNGSLDATFNVGDAFDSSTYAIKSQSDGKIVVGGAFNSYSGSNSNGIVRINTDGTKDDTFNIDAGVNQGSIEDIEIQQDGKIIAGGDFNTYGGVTANGIVKIDSEGNLDTAFNTGDGFRYYGTSIGLPYRFVQQSDGKIVAVGFFEKYDNSTEYGIVRINTDGTKDTSFDTGGGFGSSNESGLDVVIQQDGKILVVGYFSTYSGSRADGIVRINTDGTIDSSFNSIPGFDGSVSEIKIQPDGKILVAGAFSSYGGFTRNNIVSVNQIGQITASFNSGVGFDSDVYSMVSQSDGKIVVVGNFSTYSGSTAGRIVRINANGTLDTTFNTGNGFSGAAYSIKIQSDGKIIVGGYFNNYSGSYMPSIVRINTNGSMDSTFSAGSGFNNYVEDLAIQSDGKIIAVGPFSSYQGSTANRIARLNTNGTRDLTFSTSGFNSIAKAIAIQSDGKIIVGGGFTTYNGSTANCIVRINTNGTADNLFGTGFNSQVNTIAIQSDGKILVGGYFTSYQGSTANRIIRLNSNNTRDTSFNPGLGFAYTGSNYYSSGQVENIKIQSDGKIVVLGLFNFYSGSSVSNIVRLNTNGTIDTSFTASLKDYSDFTGAPKTSIIKSGGEIIIGGNFNVYGNYLRNNLARLNSDGTIDSAFNIGSGFNDTVSVVGLQSNGKIIAGGYFRVYRNLPANGLVMLNTDGTVDTSFNIGAGFEAGGYIYGMSIQSDDKILVGGYFTTYSGSTASKIVRINSDGTRDTSFNTGLGFNNFGTVYDLGIQSNGKILAVGTFDNYSGSTATYVVRINTDGTIDENFSVKVGSNYPSSVSIISNDNIIIGGYFNLTGFISTNNIVRINTDGTPDTSFNIGDGFDYTVRAINIEPDGKILAGGEFYSYNNYSASAFTRLNSDGTFDQYFENPVQIDTYTNYANVITIDYV